MRLLPCWHEIGILIDLPAYEGKTLRIIWLLSLIARNDSLIETGDDIW